VVYVPALGEKVGVAAYGSMVKVLDTTELDVNPVSTPITLIVSDELTVSGAV
jgi:hypothetical protein